MISTYFLLKSYIGPGGVFGGPGGGLGGPGGGFRTGRSSGKATAGTCAKKNHPQDHPNYPQDTKNTTRTTKVLD